MFCGDVLEGTSETVTWGPHSARSNFRIADGKYDITATRSAYGCVQDSKELICCQ